MEKLNISLFLDQYYIDVKKKVKILLNGKVVIQKKLTADIAYIAEPECLFGDSKRFFPCKVIISILLMYEYMLYLKNVMTLIIPKTVFGVS